MLLLTVKESDPNLIAVCNFCQNRTVHESTRIVVPEIHERWFMARVSGNVFCPEDEAYCAKDYRFVNPSDLKDHLYSMAKDEFSVIVVTLLEACPDLDYVWLYRRQV